MTASLDDTTAPAAGSEAPAASRRRRLTLFLPWIVLAVLYAVTVARAPGYLKPAQLGSLLQLLTILATVSIGQLGVILVGGIDLSVSTVMTLANIMSAGMLAGHDGNLPAAIGVTLAAGAVIGLLNGLVITKLGVPDMIATLATMTVVLGAGYLYSGGSPGGGSSPGLTAFVTHRIGGLVTPATIAWLVVAAVLIVALRSSVFGRKVFAVGLSDGASRASGISVHRTRIMLYVISGTCAAAAGILLTGYTGSSFLGSGDPYQLMSIAAVVLGGASIFGGNGGYGNTIAGVAIITLLLSVLQVIGIPTAGQDILYGVVILVMLVLFRYSGNREVR